MYTIKICGLNLFLHKSSNMFTTDIAQARTYKSRKGAENWICDKFDDNEYNNRFDGLEFLVWAVEELNENNRD